MKFKGWRRQDDLFDHSRRGPPVEWYETETVHRPSARATMTCVFSERERRELKRKHGGR